VNNSARTARVAVSADGRGLVSQAEAVLLWETMRVTGLARGLSQGRDDRDLALGERGGVVDLEEDVRVLPTGRHLRRRVPVRTDSAGGTHGFLDWLTAPSRRLHYSVGMTITEDMQAAILKVPAGSWTPAGQWENSERLDL
jgi:hypothetical protein